MDDDLGVWNYIHATSSGFLPIITWEALKEYLALGPTCGICAIIAGVTWHAVVKHRSHLKGKINERNRV